jgi:acyl transferase domain-containing protein/acyl-CoA thioesterase FadM
MSYFAVPYTIHFDDTMAYGGHHFLTAFKLQCEGRESLLFGSWGFGAPGVRDDFGSIHLLTGEAYARNLASAHVGDRLVVLVTFEARGLASLRFCFRVLDVRGAPICCGFQTVVCANPRTGEASAFPESFLQCFEGLRALDEPAGERSFRDRVLAGGAQTTALFDETARAAAIEVLDSAAPVARIVDPAPSPPPADDPRGAIAVAGDGSREAWIFSGQGTFDPELLSQRIAAMPEARADLDAAARAAEDELGDGAFDLLAGNAVACRAAAERTPALEQLGIFLQNVLGARARQRRAAPAVLLGHSFGQIAALCVAGCFDLATGARIVARRTAALASLGVDAGGLLAVALDRPAARAWLGDLELDDLVIAGRNHARQVVVAGPRPSLAALEAALRGASIGAVPVRAAVAFHHPALEPAGRRWLKALRALPLGAPRYAVYSSVGRRMVGDDDDIAAALVAELVRPFDLEGAIGDLADAGVVRFVDCGTTGSLERLVRRAGGDRIAVERVAGDAIAVMAPRPPPIDPVRCDRPPVALVGMGCLLPGGSRDRATLWQNLVEGIGGIFDQRAVDPDWERDFFASTPTPDRSTSALAGLVADADLEPPAGLAARTFASYSRGEQILAVALGQCRSSVPPTGRIRCLVGATADGFAAHDVASSLAAAGIDPDDPRIAARRGRGGPCVPHEAIARVVHDLHGDRADVVLLDAACASSLYCVALGMRALETGEADTVIAGGIFAPGPGNSCLFSQFGGLSPDGCRPFTADANGVVFGEGAAFVVLRRLDDAERDGATIEAIVRGAGLASDGLSPSAIVPQSAGQVRAMQRCYAAYGLDPASIPVIEAHGTGTPVGDGTELRSLQAFFQRRAQGPLAVRSLKALIGHTGWAAGTASVIAMCEALQRGLVAPQAHHGRPCAALEEAGPLLSVSSAVEAWPAAMPRGAINGFGFGGSDAHVVIEAYQPGSLAGPAPEVARDELVVVATGGWFPGADGALERRPVPDAPGAFDRVRVGLPEGVVVLPDLADDMDVTQRLVLHAATAALESLPEGARQLRGDTALVLALNGKTERGVEATLRVLAGRIARQLDGMPEAVRIRDAAANVRPSGPYTLQAMMPNLASGRAASRLDLCGPNFVVDAGARSVDAMLDAAALLLGDSARIVLATAVCASHYAAPHTREAVVCLAVTTPDLAAELGLAVLARLRRGADVASAPGAPRADAAMPCCGATGAEALLLAVDAAARGSATAVSFAGGATWTVSPSTVVPDAVEPAVTMHQPVWVTLPSAAVPAAPYAQAILVAPADPRLTAELLAASPRLARAVRIAVPAGVSSSDPRIIAIDVADERRAEAGLARLDGFTPEAIIAVDRPGTLDLRSALAAAACDRRSLDLVFLIAKRRASSLRARSIDLFSLCLGGIDASGLLHPASGGPAGLLKSLARELGGEIRPIVTTTASVADGFALLARERAAPSDGSCEEIGYIGDVRQARRLLESELGDAQPPALDERSVVLVTGGARGVTAILSEAVLARWGCTVVALGRSLPEEPPAEADVAIVEREFYAAALRATPQIDLASLRARFARNQASWEVHRELERLRRLPGRVFYHAVDLTRAADVERAVAEIVETHGSVDWIVHGAGVQFSKRLERRSLEELRATLDVKLGGLHHLVTACGARRGALVPVHVLTSAYSFYGNDGQPDYGAANETLDRLCALARAHGHGPWSSIGWLGWDGIGMTRGSEYAALAEERGLSRIGPALGRRIFLDVLDDRTRSAINVQLSPAERARYGVRVVASQPDRARADAVCSVHDVDLDALAFLAHHRVRGQPTIPGAFALDWFVQAAVAAAERHDRGAPEIAVLEDISFSRLLRKGDAYRISARAELAGSPDVERDAWRARLVGDVRHATGVDLECGVTFCEAQIRLRPEFDGERPTLARCGTYRAQRDPYCDATPGAVSLSGPFDCLREIEIGAAGRQALFVPPDRHDDCLGAALPALLLDAAWRLSMMHAGGAAGALFVPVRVERVTAARCPEFDGPPVIRAAAPTVDDGTVSCARAEVTDRRGRVRLRIEGSVARRLS